MSANTATVEGTTRGTLLVVDGHSLAFRAFFALPVENFSTSAGQATNAVWGFPTMLSQVIDAELASCTAAEVFKIQTRVHFRRSGKD